MTKFHYDIIETSLDSVNAVPSNAILCLFETAISSAKYVLTSGGSEWSANKYTQDLPRNIPTRTSGHTVDRSNEIDRRGRWRKKEEEGRGTSATLG